MHESEQQPARLGAGTADTPQRSAGADSTVWPTTRGRALSHGRARSRLQTIVRSAVVMPVLRLALRVMAVLLSVHCADDGGSSNFSAAPMPAPTAPAPTATAGSNAASGSNVASGAPARHPPEAFVLGVCLAEAQQPNVPCTGLDAALDCARSQCSVTACLATCSEFVQCAQASDDECAASLTCHADQPCLDCIASNLVCVWADRCRGLFQCGAAATNGACAKLEACCMQQSNPTPCLGWVMGARMLSGDPSCQMFIDDPGFVAAYAHEGNCVF